MVQSKRRWDPLCKVALPQPLKPCRQGGTAVGLWAQRRAWGAALLAPYSFVSFQYHWRSQSNRSAPQARCHPQSAGLVRRQPGMACAREPPFFVNT
ncbi:hypothetical protein NBRC116598_07810 [Pseudophaeobacter arcticus]|uniref:Uncharacterized protein n=1 Tax=Pseudophaeobacter arcticus TaxID=385492 RepID=A0ABQ0AHI7_9RHOB